MNIIDKILIAAAIILIIFLLRRVFVKKYFWKDRKGNKIGAKEFGSRFIKGVQGITPLQQTRVSIISFFPLFAGLFWGIIVTFFGKTYWLCLILTASIPITLMNFVSTIQKYYSQKKAQEAYKQAMEDFNKKKGKKK